MQAKKKAIKLDQLYQIKVFIALFKFYSGLDTKDKYQKQTYSAKS